jgi:hypothetical protein
MGGYMVRRDRNVSIRKRKGLYQPRLYKRMRGMCGDSIFEENPFSLSHMKATINNLQENFCVKENTGSMRFVSL